MCVAEDLNLHMTRPDDVLLDVHGVIAERRLRLTTRHLQGRRERLCVAHDAHPLPATSGCRLQQDRIAESFGDLARFTLVAKRLRCPWHHRHTRGNGQLTRRGLASHRGDRLSRRSDEHKSCLLHGAGKPLSLRKESVPGMDRLRAGFQRGVDDRLAAQVALGRWRRSDVKRLIRCPHVRRSRVCIAIHSDGGDAELVTGANHAERDLAAIGDENFGKHQLVSRMSSRAKRAGARIRGCGVFATPRRYSVGTDEHGHARTHTDKKQYCF